MGDFLSKFSKAVDAFADVLTEDVSATKNVALYKFSDLKSFVFQMRKKFPSVSQCKVSMAAQTEFDGMVFPEAKYVIRILLLDGEKQPISIGRESNAYLGKVIIASSVDAKMKEIMKGKAEQTLTVRGEK